MQRGQLTGTSRFVNEVELIPGFVSNVENETRRELTRENKSVPFILLAKLGMTKGDMTKKDRFIFCLVCEMRFRFRFASSLS